MHAGEVHSAHAYQALLRRCRASSPLAGRPRLISAPLSAGDRKRSAGLFRAPWGPFAGPFPEGPTPMDTRQIVTTFLDFYRDRGHHLLGDATLIPSPGDPVLFTSAGMHPLTPYLEG